MPTRTVMRDNFRKTKLMRSIESRYGKPLEALLPEKYNELGLPAMAEEFGLSKATLWYWFIRCGIRLERKALSPWQSVKVVG